MFKDEKRFFIGSVIFYSIILLLIVVGDGLFINVDLLKDRGASWYYWKLPTTNLAIRLSYWIPYIIHQCLIWFFIKKIADLKNTTDNKITVYNKALLITNFVFVIVHLIQTWVFYDGLAQDVPVFSSQGSVILVLVLIIIMQNHKRGIFFGKKANLPKKSVSTVYKYHGFFMAWAFVYTFWYHPMVNTPGHLVGFLYMFLFFIQMSLPKMQLHSNKYWTFALEITVLIHGTTVALMGGSNIWTMFFSGFGFIFICTQIYGLGLNKKGIYIGTALYAIITLFLYTMYPYGEFSFERFAKIQQFAWIPIIEYGLVFLITIVLWLIPNVSLNKENNRRF